MRGQRGERDERKEDRRGILHKLTSILLNLGDPLKLFLLPVLPTCFSSLFYLPVSPPCSTYFQMSSTGLILGQVAFDTSDVEASLKNQAEAIMRGRQAGERGG
jgi:hypothetical protein